jgi:hypothetical protein
MKTDNPEVARHLMTYSDHALACIERDLRRHKPEWRAKGWAEERLAMVRAELARRVAEDLAGTL